MFRPVLRIVGHYFAAMGFLAAVSGVYLAYGGGSAGRVAYLFTVGMGTLALGIWLRQWAGEGDLVGVEPGDIAHDFRIAIAYGLGAHAAPIVTAAAGAAASAATILFVALLGFVSPGALAGATIVFAAYGTVLALAKRRALRRGAFVRRKGRNYGAHRTLSVFVVPVVVVAWLIASAPEADGAIVLLIGGVTLFWIGAAFHHLWEVFHIAALVLIYKEDSQATIEWALAEWIRYVRTTDKVTAVAYDPESAVVHVDGDIQDFDEFSRELARLDFVSKVAGAR